MGRADLTQTSVTAKLTLQGRQTSYINRKPLMLTVSFRESALSWHTDRRLEVMEKRSENACVGDLCDFVKLLLLPDG